MAEQPFSRGVRHYRRLLTQEDKIGNLRKRITFKSLLVNLRRFILDNDFPSSWHLVVKQRLAQLEERTVWDRQAASSNLVSLT